MSDRQRKSTLDNDLEQLATCTTSDLASLSQAAGLDPSSDFVGADLRGADLRGQDLRGFNLTGEEQEQALL